MKRDLRKACADYESMTKGGKSNKGAFYVDDIKQIREIILDRLGEQFSASDLLYEAIFVSLKIGFIVGYRAGKRNTRKQHAA